MGNCVSTDDRAVGQCFLEFFYAFFGDSCVVEVQNVKFCQAADGGEIPGMIAIVIHTLHAKMTQTIKLGAYAEPT